MTTGRVQVSTGFLVLLGILFYLDEGLGLFWPGLLACAVHELGHVLVIGCLGGGIRCLKLTAVGAELALDEGRPLSYGGEALAAAAGPVANVLCAWLAWMMGAWTLAGLSLGQGLFNLLPVAPLDGGRLLHSVVSCFWDERGAERVSEVVSAVLVGILLGLGWVLLGTLANPTLALTSGWMLLGLLKRRGETWKKVK